MLYAGNGAGLTQENICGGADNKCYVTTRGDGNFKPDGTETEGDNTNIIYFPVVGAVDFYAYYPFVFPLTDYTYPLDVTVQSSQEAVDFMYAGKVEGCTKDNPKVGFNFVHKLSKLVLEISPGDGLNTADLRNLGVTVGNQPIKATFNLSNGTLMCGADKSDITLFTTESGTLSEAILLPNSVKSRVLTFDLNNGNDEPFTWTMDKALDAGSKYTYEVRLHRTKVEITSASITGWTLENGGAVDAH